jgi:hypothetical protein
LASRLAAFSFFLELDALLDRQHLAWRLAKPFQVTLLDELPQGQLPAFLTVIIKTAEFLGVHTQLARHLNLRMRKLMPFSGVDPDSVLLGEAFLFGHWWTTVVG